MRIVDGVCFINAREIRALLAFASKDETRPHLTGIWIDMAGHAFATDGHRLAVLGDWEKRGGDLIYLTREDADRCARIAGKGEVMVGYDVDGFDLSYVDGTFKVGPPPIKHAIAPAIRDAGQPTSAFVWHMNADYMAALKLVTRAAEKISVTVLAPGTHMDPVVFRAGGWLALIMPMRFEEGEAAAKAQDKRNARLRGGAA